MLTVAAARHVDILVLCAFGCRAFQNDPEVVATAYTDVLPEFSGVFLVFDIAVINIWRDERSYKVFTRYFG